MITPEDLIEYTVYEEVKTRPVPQLQADIIQAKAYIYKTCNHKFERYAEIPEEVTLAAKILAQGFALSNSNISRASGLKSETLSDYSYTLGSVSDGNSSSIDVAKNDVFDLLYPYIIAKKVFTC